MKRKKVLIGGSDPAAQIIIASYLRRQGFLVDSAGCSSDCISSLCSGKPDVVLLDMTLPGIEAVQLLKEMRTDAQRVPVIMMTSETEIEVGERDLGVDSSIGKPCGVKEIEFAIRRLTD